MPTLCHNSGLRIQRPGGEIGRLRGLKIPRRKACRFESGPGHHILNSRNTSLCCGFFFFLARTEHLMSARSELTEPDDLKSKINLQVNLLWKSAKIA
jgi:hypothetical protein